MYFIYRSLDSFSILHEYTAPHPFEVIGLNEVNRRHISSKWLARRLKHIPASNKPSHPPLPLVVEQRYRRLQISLPVNCSAEDDFLHDPGSAFSLPAFKGSWRHVSNPPTRLCVYTRTRQTASLLSCHDSHEI